MLNKLGYMRSLSFFIGKAAIFLIRLYQLLISPVYMPCCRFYPTCSEYLIQALLMHGTVKGFWLSIKRLLRCHPLSRAGIDPVPVPEPNQNSFSWRRRVYFYYKHSLSEKHHDSLMDK